MVSQAISHYRIIKKLGAGGMGEVYLAEDTRLGRKVAIKRLLPKSAGDERARKRLIREARAAARLDHPNICAIHDNPLTSCWKTFAACEIRPNPTRYWGLSRSRSSARPRAQ